MMMILSTSRRSWSEKPNLVQHQLPDLVLAAEERVRDRLRLLVNLLAHEPVVTALLGGRQVPVDVVGLGFRGTPMEVGDLDAGGGDRDDLVLPELEGIASVLDECGDVGGEEVLAIAEADDQRRVSTGGNDHVRGPVS